MSIEEALNRRQEKGEVAQKGSREGHDEKRVQRNKYEEEVFQRGITLLHESGAVGMMENLREHILEEFPDARLENVDPSDYGESRKFNIVEGGMVEISLGWKYKLGVGSHYRRINVLAQPLTEAIVVEGMGAEFIPATTWRTHEGKTVLEDAIVDAYSNPPRYAPPIRIG